MKKILFVFCITLFVTGLAAAQSAGSTLYVTVKTLTLKSGTGYFDSNKGTLKYGDKVTVLKIDGKFAEVQSAENPSITGWTATTNFSKKQIVAGSSTTVSSKELALAGKGFSQETEKLLKDQKTNLNFADVDKTEAIKVNEKNLKIFLEGGQLKMGNNK